jgi:alkylhydroperoxidase family enzyme
MLDYAVKLTRTPNAITIEDIDLLHAVGFNDRAAHDICTIAAYYAFVNRIADGLGVEMEEVKENSK